jgi:hypothetical protein
MDISKLSAFDGYVPCGEFYPLFLEKLQEENGWSSKFSEQAITEYIKFLKIITVFGVKQTPSEVVDEVWHLHLQFTKDYWENLCPRILGLKLHHVPTFKNIESDHINKNQYKKTLENYQQLFGVPPVQIWGQEKEAQLSKTGNNDTNLKSTLGLSLGLILFGLIGAPNFTFFPSISGSEFLILYAVLLVVYNLIAFISLKLVPTSNWHSLGIALFQLGYFAIGIFGGLRVVHGLSNGYPVSYLVLEIIAGALVVPFLIFSEKNRSNNGSCSSSCTSSSTSSSSCSSGSGCGGCGGGD